jgi:hypothetical protein
MVQNDTKIFLTDDYPLKTFYFRSFSTDLDRTEMTTIHFRPLRIVQKRPLTIFFI